MKNKELAAPEFLYAAKLEHKEDDIDPLTK